MRLSRRFAADSESVRQSREFVIDALVDVPSDVQASIAMMVSELATNAFIHGGSGFEVTIERARAFIRVEVRDEGIGAPALQSPRPSEPHGRGLQIVMQLSNEWGISQEPGQAGKTVWFKVNILGDARIDDGAVRRGEESSVSDDRGYQRAENGTVIHVDLEPLPRPLRRTAIVGARERGAVVHRVAGSGAAHHAGWFSRHQPRRSTGQVSVTSSPSTR